MKDVYIGGVDGEPALRIVCIKDGADHNLTFPLKLDDIDDLIQQLRQARHTLMRTRWNDY